MPALPPSEFYTGLVADLYRPLRSTTFPADRYRQLLLRLGEPGLELGCGDGDPLLDLRGSGLDVDGIDSSPDMIERLHRRAADQNLAVNAWVADMQTMRLPRAYRTVFLAGPTFNLLPDDRAMGRALSSIAGALAADGTAVIPLFEPEPVGPDEIGALTRRTTPTGWIGWKIVKAARDADTRTQTLTLRYERVDSGASEVLERDWVIHWIDLDGFAELARHAGLRVDSAEGEVGPEPVDVILRLC